MNKKQIIILAICSVIVIFMVTMAIINSKPDINCKNPKFAEYISAYTEGTISKNSSIKIILNSELAEKIDRNAKVENLIRIYPKVSGTSKFIDDRTIEFTPTLEFRSGKEYIAEFKLGRLTKMEKGFRRFVFPFSTIKQDLKVLIDDQITTDSKTLKYQQIQGSVKTADFERIENIKRSVNAEYMHKKVQINWKESDVAQIFNFTIDSIERGEKSRNLTINFDGLKIGSDTKGSRTVVIPAITEFKTSKIEVINEPTQMVKIRFTDPLKESQNLNGLVTIIDPETQRLYNKVEYKIQSEGNCINIYPSERKKGEIKITLASGIANVLDYKLAEDKTYSVDFEPQKPQIRTVKSGLILPSSDNGLVYPFEAINLTAVDVTIIKVLEKNILSYIRDFSDYYNNGNLERTGVPVFRKTIHITDAESEEATNWNRYYLELSKLINTEPGSIYNIKIAFRKSQAIFDCDTCGGGDYCDDEQDIDVKNFDEIGSYNFDDDYCHSAGWNWENEENPCYKMYYSPDRFINQSILASNLGMIAKKGEDRSLTIFVTDLKTAKPANETTVEIYGYQQQLLDQKVTNSDGKVEFGVQKKAYFAIAKRGQEANYLKLEDGNSLSMSKFDISGNEVKDGLKGYIYGERGVWRPGDSIHLSFILKEDLERPLPNDYPITLEVSNSYGQQIVKETVKKNNSNFYVFNFKTDNDAVTGSYEANIICGNSRFTKQLRIENIKPNRLKINLDFNKKAFTENDNKLKIKSSWLHGASAENLKVSVTQKLTKSTIKFDQWKDYCFENVRTEGFESYDENVFSGTLNKNGEASVDLAFEKNNYNAFPSKMKATYETKVFEKSGNFSRDETSIDVYPYKNYIGIKLPDNDNRFLEVNSEQTVNLVVTDNQGALDSKPHDICVKLYKLEWQWWYDHSNYVSQYNSVLVDADTLKITGKGNYKFLVKYPDWGRFMIEATDIKSGISSSEIFYMDWPDTYGRSPMLSQGSTIVELSSDKQKYTIGEIAKISIPSSEGGSALVSIESGTKVIRSQWITTKAGSTNFDLEITDKMEPGVYINVSLLQPHAQSANDMPIRMYGVLPLSVENPATILEPVITMKDNIEAETEAVITVSEKNNKPMTYTLALVDDGILDLTHYKTPDPWKKFYSREALSVKTIDMYDNVIGAFGGKIEKMFTIGGDDEYKPSSAKKANNFETVVAFLGPFTTNGGKETHKIKLPKYIGSVRAMVVAGNGRAFGNAEKTAIVNKPLMIFATTPRVLGTGDKFKLPITVFTGLDDIKNVNVKIKASNGFSVSGTSSQDLTFSGKGEQNPTFDIVAGDKSGIGTIEVSAISGNHHSTMKLDIEIREPNTKSQQTITKNVDPGETVDIDFVPVGRQNTNTATMNISGILPINLESHIERLLAYSYESLEQTVSQAFPLLYTPKITDMSSAEKEREENLIREAIKKIYAYQSASGGLSYWRNETYSDVWITNYAGHFMLEAQKAGFFVKTDFLDKWKKYQRLKAESWTPDNKESYKNQAYRLYTLALANEAQNGQMNRLKEQPNLPDEAKPYLAAAYALNGKKSIGEGIIKQVSLTRDTDKPSKLIALCELESKNEAFAIAQALSEELSEKYYWETCRYEAISIVAMGKYFDKYKPTSKINCSYNFNGQSKKIDSDKIFSSNKLEIKSTEKQLIKFTNNTNGILFVEINNQGIPEAGNEKAENSVITAEISYNIGGQPISPSKIAQGTEFQAVIKIKNPSDEYFYQMAMTQMFPAGWEINNTLSEQGSSYDYYDSTPKGRIKNKDVRDDREYTYFTLPAHGEITIKTNLIASYKGTYYLPGIICNNLDNNKIYAKTKGSMVEIN